YNNDNYSYPYCQNQGIEKASHDVLAFFNNDIILSPNWDEHLLNILGKDGREVVSFASNDRGVSQKDTKTTSRRWKRIKYPILTIFGTSYFSLQLMFKLMYKSWKKYTSKVFKRYGYEMIEGFSGSAIAMTRNTVEKVGLWDERPQAADFDLYARTKQRYEEHGDIKPLSIISGVYIHHYERLTAKSKQKPVQFADIQNIVKFEDKWEDTKYDILANDLKQQ
ncbi:MAG: glycosyltransferase, partial [Prevotellaceae bacterium]|nr:glycosyltransferase [Prevotellaceae bacterium]